MTPSKRQCTASGFTLLEVLVALAITGLTVTMFLQLLSSSLRLEHKAQTRTEAVLAARLAFDQLINRDVREDDFPWQGEAGETSWAFAINPVQTVVTLHEAAREQPSDAGTPSIRLQTELYQYVFDFFPARGVRITLSQLKTHPRTYFSPSFREKRMGDSVSGGVLPVDTDADPLAAGEEEPPAGMVKGSEDGL